MQLRYTFHAPYAGAFQQKLDCQQCFIFGNSHTAEQTRAAFGVGLSALSATETAKAIALLPELHALNVARWAIHGKTTLQQAVAVVKWYLTWTLVLSKLSGDLTNYLGVAKFRV